jgi:hypothetical protein
MMSREGREEKRSIRAVWVSVETECGRLGDDNVCSGADDQKGLEQKTTRRPSGTIKIYKCSRVVSPVLLSFHVSVSICQDQTVTTHLKRNRRSTCS